MKQKILLIKRGAIGDLLMATPFIRQLKNSTNCSIDILVGKDASIVLKENHYINNKFIIDDSWFTIRNAHKFIKYLHELRKNNYDYVFVLDKHWYFNLCANILGGITIGFKREGISRYLLDYSVKYDDVCKYHGIYNLDLLSKIKPQSVNYNDLSLGLAIGNDARIKVDNWLSKANIIDFVVVVNSGGNNAYETNGARMLPKGKVLLLIKELSKIYSKVLLVGGKSDYENYSDYMDCLNSLSNVINIAGVFNLAASAYLLSLSKKSYITDCGALHLAVASGCKDNLVAMFASTNPKHVLPENLVSRAYWSDEDIYDKNYSLYGNKKVKHPEYFTKLKIRDLIDFDCSK